MTELTMKHWVNGQEVVEDGADVIAIDSPTTGEAVSYTHLTLPTNREV